MSDLADADDRFNSAIKRRYAGGWSEEESQQLRRLWGDGKSAGQIAALIPGKTRNAIIGRAHRLGLAGRPSPFEEKRVQPLQDSSASAAAPKPARRTADGRVWRAGSAPSVTPAPKLLPAEASILGPGTCQWIEADPQVDATKCGARAVLGRPWCPDHLARCFSPRLSKTEESA